jgi:hypothetical protein
MGLSVKSAGGFHWCWLGLLCDLNLVPMSNLTQHQCLHLGQGLESDPLDLGLGLAWGQALDLALGPELGLEWGLDQGRWELGQQLGQMWGRVQVLALGMAMVPGWVQALLGLVWSEAFGRARSRSLTLGWASHGARRWTWR